MTNLQLFSYLYGLFGTDGHAKIYNNKLSSIQMEVSIKDKDDILRISDLIGGTVTYRNRITNFSDNYDTCILYTSNKDLIEFLVKNDFPLIDKTNTIHKPTKEYDEDYFWLGVIDGDGSLGFKKDGYPFINLTTKSELLKEDFLDYIEKSTSFRPNVNRNARDNIYNIGIGSQKAKIIAEKLYKDKEIYLNRKFKQYQNIEQWHLQDLSKVIRTKWTKEEEEDLIKMTVDEFLIKYPNRTIPSIKGKRQRMKKEGLL